MKHLFKTRYPMIQYAIRSFFFFLLPFTFLLLISCEKNTTPVAPPDPRLTLAIEEVAVTEAWLTLTVEDRIDNLRFALLRDDSLISNGPLTTDDTTLYDTGLLPAHSYTYAAQLLRNGHPGAAGYSASVEITTMDTTSHNFSWEIIEFPNPYGSGVLRDVSIINENDIWAVGEIYSDSVQPWLPYNAVHWDGQQWELKRIKTNSCGGVEYPPIQAVFSFAADDILFAHIDGSISHYNGIGFTNDCSLITQFNGSANKMWGRSRNDLCVVSGNGFIAHYNGNSWQKLESGTSLPIQDIWGAINPRNGKYEILCVAEHISPGGSKVLSIEGANVRELPTTGLLSWGLWGIWFVPGRQYLAVGDGLWQTHSLSGPWSRNNSLPALFKTSIHGEDLNDVVVGGAFWLLAHYNGMNWQTYFPRTSGSFTAVQMKDDLIIAVGGAGNRAAVAVGRR